MVKRVATGLIFFALSISACAQQSDLEDLTSLSLEELMQVRLATASRHLDDPQKAPSLVTVIGGDEIRLFGWKTLADLLRSVPGFYTAYDRTYQYAGVHGFLESSNFNARYLLLVDGHRINENVYDSALIGTEFPLDMSRIDRVEIIRGPGSALYGTNAMLAVINIYTRRPDSQPTAEIVSSVQSFAGRQGEVSSSFRMGHYDGLLSASLYRSNGARQLYFEEYDTPEFNHGLASDIDGERFLHLFGQIRRGQFRLEGLWGSRLKIIPNAPYNSNFNDPEARSTDGRGFVEASYHRNVGATEFDFRAFYDATRYKGTYPYGGTDSPNRSVEINDAFADWFGGEVVAAHKLGKHRLVGGLYGDYNPRLDQRSSFKGQQPFLNDHRTRTLIAFFGEAEFNPKRWLSINAGGRLDLYSYSGMAASPRLAIMWLPSARSSFKFITSTAFREPSPYDLYSVDLELQGNTKLVPERNHAEQLLFEQKLSSWGSFSIAAFCNRLDKSIEQAMDQDLGETILINEKGDSGSGAELEFSLKNRSGWRARGSYTYARNIEEDASRIVTASPQHLAKINAVAPLRSFGTLGFELAYNSSQNSYSDTRVSSSFLTNATVSTREFRNGLTFSLSAYNLMNRSWATPTGPEVKAAGTVQDGRTIRFQLTYRKPWGRK